jgi:hypothetical protein
MNKRPSKSWFLKAVDHTACLLAVMAMLGGHWAALQSVAWVRMIVSYAQHDSLRTALAKTFDGRHPCALCLAIEKGRQQEQTENKNLPAQRADQAPEFVCDVQRTAAPLPPMTATQAVPFVPVCHPDFIQTPPSPPPRFAASLGQQPTVAPLGQVRTASDRAISPRLNLEAQHQPQCQCA